MLRPFLVLSLALSVAGSLPAQRLGPPVERPRLRDVTDTNDAQAYYNQGLEQFERDPEAAGAAFYWAARINPAWGEAIYARRAALIMGDQSVTKKYFERSRNDRRNGDLLRIDSLQFRALMWSPFLYRRLDRQMFTTYFRNQILQNARMNGGGEPARGELDFYIERYLRESGPGTKAWLAYADGDFPSALKYYSSAMGSSRDKAGVHVERARIFGMRAQVDSAVGEFDGALVELRKKDQKDLVVFYDSKAQAEFSKAVLLEGAGNTTAARDAYSQALQEDLAYYPAHLRLGLLALSLKDTAMAASELALAAQIASDEPHIRYMHGYVLATTGQNAEAVKELEKAVELEPFYALPYLRIGQVYERLGKGPEALKGYEGFLAHAAVLDVQREYATGRIAEIKEILATAAPQP